MITITKERLLTIQQWRETYGPGSNVVLPAEEAEELARIALALLEAEPLVPVMYKGMKLLTKEGLELIRDGIAEATGLEAMCMAEALLSGASVPSVPEEMYWQDAPVGGSSKAAAYATGWNACRAAMLQAEPVSNSDELPLDYLQGHKDGLEWAAQLAEANHPQTGDWLYDDPIDLARAIRKGPDMPTVQAGNYPVTPDGWISCSERMPAQDDWILIYSKHGEYMAGQVQGEYVELSDGTLSWLGNALYWMPLPEPPQEVN